MYYGIFELMIILEDGNMSNYEEEFYNYSCSCFKSEIRTQITILEDSNTIYDLLNQLQDNSINLDGYYYQNIKCDINIFTFEIGNETE